jgi:hypothetical protein
MHRFLIETGILLAAALLGYSLGALGHTLYQLAKASGACT